MTEDRKQAAIDAVEALVVEYQDIFAPELEMPVIVDWVLVIAHDDATDPESGGVYRLNRRFQSNYRSAGLLQMAVDDYRGVSIPEDAE